ncbi:MAG: paraquat-inducible protein A [Deltaproteobacteria bacterium]|nr:paraquat-inducible protein A [Deltaproteobacteria bacterium]
MKLLNLILSLIIIIASVILCHQIISNSISNQENKNDYAELNHVNYGLLSVEEWKRQITVIISEEINKLYLSRANERDLRKHIEVLLNTLIDKVDKKIREGNLGSAEGWVKQSFINIFISLEDIKKGIPEYADAVIHEMTKSKTRDQIKTMLNKQLKQYSNQTFDTRDTSQMSRILLRTDSKDIESARININKAISVKHKLIFKEAILLIILSVILFALSGFSKQPLAPSRYILLILSLIILLIAGVTTPTIDMEAKISQMSFVLMGHPIHFENQVLYFQSKSILDVFWIMITHQDIQMKFVGVLLITFSIIIPLLKIVSSLGYYYNYHHARENPVIKFFVLKSGKWSMADVMVVAIFMAYIGFNGIITSQFGQLSSAGQELVIVTTNDTSLQPGFYLFLTYTLLALFLSGFLTRKPQAS